MHKFVTIKHMLKNLLLFVILAVAFAGLFATLKGDASLSYQAAIENIPSVKMFGSSETIEKDLAQFGIATGAVLGFSAFILSAIVFGILKIFRAPSKIAAGISNMLSYSGIAALGYELVYLEEKNSALAAAIVFYLGKPLFYSGIIVAILALTFLVLSFIQKKNIEGVAQKALLLLMIISPFIFSGCSLLGSATELSCGLAGGGKNAAHCYQEAAVQKNDEKICDKAPQGEEFKKLGSNPPQDKCYYMVAENKRDTDVCDKIKGGLMSYSADECKTNVMDSAEKEISEKLKKTDDGKNLSPEELALIQKQLSDYNKTMELMTNLTKGLHDSNSAIVGNLR